MHAKLLKRAFGEAKGSDGTQLLANWAHPRGEFSMTDSEIRALLTIALMSATADGASDERERTALKAVAGRLAGSRVDLADVYDDVLLRKISIADAVRPLTTPEAKRLAYETAVALADADAVHSPAEGEFLSSLAAALGLPDQQAETYVAQADAVAAASGVEVAGGTEPVREMRGHVMPDVSALDDKIVRASITNAALELLPESLASMAILPLQVRLVYQIGQAYGYELNQGHIKEFIATLGVGLTGQYLEQFGRKLLGGLLGAVLGGVGRGVGHQAASSGMSFATTWALGQLAKQYYSGGRTLDAGKLKASFAPLVEQGQGLLSKYGGEIAERARTIDVRNLPALIKTAF
jgi:uncharacterized protein (DUF697 family)/tellurite resistance protein